MTASTSQKRTFKVGSQLIFDSISKQAGTLSKAILEGVMNAVDAGAKDVTVQITGEKVTIRDDGRGFRGQDEIDKFFEVFGQPRQEGESKVFGKFRMGRGQLFAFGVNHWRSGQFGMDVDFKNKGLDYKLSIFEVVEHKGCQIIIDLYAPLLPSEIGALRRELNLWCKWCPIEVTVNDEVVTRDPAKAKWDHATDEAYIRLKDTGSLTVYNQGIFVMEIPNYRYGTGGEVVTKLGKDLDVNYARNDILSTCKVWRRLNPLINKSASDRIRTKTSLNDAERQRIIDQIRYEELDPGLDDSRLKILTAVTGRHYSVAELDRANGYACYSGAPRGNRKGAELMEARQAFVFAHELLRQFDVATPDRLMELLHKVFKRGDRHYGLWSKSYVPYQELVTATVAHRTLREDELTPTERIWVSVLINAASLAIESDVTDSRGYPTKPYGWSGGRKIFVGVGEGWGWTDGKTYVVVNRDYLHTLEFDVASYTDLGHLLIHEICHDKADTTEHDHDQTFFERFHEISGVCLGKFVAACQTRLVNAAEHEGRKLTKRVLAQQDKEVRGQRALEKVLAD